MAKSDGMGISETVWSEADEVLTDGNLRAVFERLDVNSDNSLDHYEVSGDSSFTQGLGEWFNSFQAILPRLKNRYALCMT